MVRPVRLSLTLLSLALSLVLIAALVLAFAGPWRRRANALIPLIACGFWTAFALAALTGEGWGARLQLAAGLSGMLAFGLIAAAQYFRPGLLFKRHAPPSVERLADLRARVRRREQIETELRRGNRFRAIKLYRDDTGASLAEAVAGVDDLARSSS